MRDPDCNAALEGGMEPHQEQPQTNAYLLESEVTQADVARCTSEQLRVFGVMERNVEHAEMINLMTRSLPAPLPATSVWRDQM